MAFSILLVYPYFDGAVFSGQTGTTWRRVGLFGIATIDTHYRRGIPTDRTWNVHWIPLVITALLLFVLAALLFRHFRRAFPRRRQFI